MSSVETLNAGRGALAPRGRRWLELIILFVGVPLAMAFAMDREDFRTTLLALTGVGVFFLAITPGFRWRSLFEGPVLSEWRLILFFTVGSAAVIYGALWILRTFEGAGVSLFSFPLTRPNLWAFVMVAYPLVLVPPQEVLFRSLFFDRYGDLFGGKWLAIGVNSVLFGLAHLFYWNWPAVVLTALASIFFAYAYVEKRSFLLAWVLHAIGGMLIFTMGLGRYFFHGAIPQ